LSADRPLELQPRLIVQLPVISKFEWHPFTISSAPDDKYINFHMRVAGDWTGDVHDYFKVCLIEQRACVVGQSQMFGASDSDKS
jgi:hypothetical protein